MTRAPRDIPTILTERLAVVQAIAAENSEILRLNQKAGGMMILDQKDEDEGAGDADRDAAWGTTDAALSTCRDRIEALESQLADLDRELEEATKGNTR